MVSNVLSANSINQGAMTGRVSQLMILPNAPNVGVPTPINRPNQGHAMVPAIRPKDLNVEETTTAEVPISNHGSTQVIGLKDLHVEDQMAIAHLIPNRVLAIAMAPIGHTASGLKATLDLNHDRVLAIGIELKDHTAKEKTVLLDLNQGLVLIEAILQNDRFASAPTEREEQSRSRASVRAILPKDHFVVNLMMEKLAWAEIPLQIAKDLNQTGQLVEAMNAHHAAKDQYSRKEELVRVVLDTVPIVPIVDRTMISVQVVREERLMTVRPAEEQNAKHAMNLKQRANG
jgi:hypothetical protein